MGYKDPAARSLVNQRNHLKSQLALGGIKAFRGNKRALTEAEVANGRTVDRVLLPMELEQKAILVTSIFTEERKAEVQAEIERIDRLLQMPVEARTAELAESTALSTDRIEEKVDRIEQKLDSLNVNGALPALIDAATPLEDMHIFVRQAVTEAANLVEGCKLTRSALTRYAHALQSLVDEPPHCCAYPELRSLAAFDLSELASVLNLKKWQGTGKISWQNLQQIRDAVTNASISPDGDHVRKACESRVYLRNLSFISKQPEVLAPGSLVQCRIKKAFHVAVVAEPTVWTEAESLVLAYRVLDLDNDAQNCSVPASAVVKVLHATVASTNFAVPEPMPENKEFVLDQLKRLPWPSAKLRKLAELAGLQLQPEANGFQELADWANSLLAKPTFVCLEPPLLPCTETAPSAVDPALPELAV